MYIHSAGFGGSIQIYHLWALWYLKGVRAHATQELFSNQPLFSFESTGSSAARGQKRLKAAGLPPSKPDLT